jgi:serine/threonine protein kinase/tetratricopeptide (TPR) repeat protein
MTTWNPHANELFLKALELGSAAERQAYLDGACAADAALRAEVEALLEASARAGSFLESPASTPQPVATVLEPAVAERPGTVIGPYKLLEQIGEGGFGVVFMAEQTQPVRRKVALKVLKPGMDTRQVVARFEAERQALAIMDHPNIARVVDGGATPSVRPYFVMELVKGVPITEFCNQNHLLPRQRLELFVPVCQAVQHAHHKGIIHRDLKPSNILVTMHDTTPVVKVIDFGVAKALGQKLTDQTLFTGFAQMVGTPQYMSPEQAGQSGLDIDTRSDIYSLGVLLYELLTGTTPLRREQLNGVAYDEIRRLIREQDPPKPSTRLSESKDSLPSIAAQRQLEPAKLTKLVRGELDWIVMKALEKDRNRRYETANGLAADVQRYLADEPVQACPPSAGYRLRKFVRRNRGRVFTSGLVLLALVGGVIGTSWGMVNARQAEAQANEDRDRAREAEADTKAFSEFLVHDVLSAPRPPGLQQGKGRDITLIAAVEQAERSLEQRFTDRPVAEATARHALGVTWRHQGNYAKAEAYLRRALELRLQYLGPDHRDTRDTQNSLGVLLTLVGRAKEAVPLLETALAQTRADFGPDSVYTLYYQSNLARALTLVDRPEEAIQLLQDTAARCRVLPRTPYDLLVELEIGLGRAHARAGRPTDAVTVLEQAHLLARKAFGPEDARTLNAAFVLGENYQRAGRHAEARVLLDDVLRRGHDLLGEDHPSTLLFMERLAEGYFQEKRWPEVIQLLEQALRLHQTRHGPESPDAFAMTLSLARAYQGAGRHSDAQTRYDAALKLAQLKFGAGHLNTVHVMGHRAHAYRATDRRAAIPLLEEVVALAKVELGPDHTTTLLLLSQLGDAYRRDGQVAKARAAYEEKVALGTAKNGPNDLSAELSMGWIAHIHEDLGEYGQAEAWRRRTIAAARGRGDDPLRLANNLAALGSNLVQQHKWAEAEPVCRECLDLRQRNHVEPWRVAGVQRLLGQALAGQGKFAEAEPLLLTGYQGLKEHEAQIPANFKTQRLREALESLVKLYETWGKNDEAERWRKELGTFKKKAPDAEP